MIDRFGVLGQWTGTGWDDLYAETADQVPPAAGQTFQVVGLGEPAGETTVGGDPAMVCEPTGTWGLETAPQLEMTTAGLSPIAVLASWDVQPRQATLLSAPPDVYAEAVETYLTARGVVDPSIELLQVFSVDLEGDGVDEIFITAEHFDSDRPFPFGPAAPFGAAGEYSLLLLRRVVEEEVQTAVLHEYIGDGDSESGSIAQAFRVGGFADLNGDDKMEIITNSGYHEGAGIGVWEYVNDDLGPVTVLTSGCGA